MRYIPVVTIQTYPKPDIVQCRMVYLFPNQSSRAVCTYSSPDYSECKNGCINLETYIFLKNDASNRNKNNTGIYKIIFKIPGYLDMVTLD